MPTRSPWIAALFLSPIFLSAQNRAIEDFNNRLTAVEKQVENRTFYNAPGNPKVVDGYNLFITGDFLYWKATENGLTYALRANSPMDDPLTGKIQFKDPHFRWDYGFRLGFGYNIPHGDWDLYVNWTHFNTGAHDHAKPKENSGLFPVWAFPAGTLNIGFVPEAKAFWKLNLSIIDLELGKEFFVGKKLTLHPHLDVRTVWVDQHYTVDYIDRTTPFFDQVKMKNDYWGIGPRLGIDLQWMLRWGFSINGSADAALVYGEFDISQHEEDKESPSNHLRFHEEMHNAIAITDLGIYLSWDYMFSHDQYHIGLQVGWEQTIFFEQNQLFRFLDPFYQGSIVSNQGNLMLQGITLSGRIDF